MKFFGLANPKQSAEKTKANCVVLEVVPGSKTGDKDCEDEPLLNNKRLGGANKLAVYEIPDKEGPSAADGQCADFTDDCTDCARLPATRIPTPHTVCLQPRRAV